MKLTMEQVMVAKTMRDRGTSVRQVAKQLEVTEGALRYRLKQSGTATSSGSCMSTLSCRLGTGSSWGKS